MKIPRQRRLLRALLSAAGMGLAILSTGGVPRAAEPVRELDMPDLGLKLQVPEGWSVPPQRLIGMREIINVPAGQQGSVSPTAAVKIYIEDRTDHAEALLRLQQIQFGIGAPSTAYTSIGGWPAFQYSRIEDRPQPIEEPGWFTDPRMLRITTAVAAGSRLVRLESTLPSASATLMTEAAQAVGLSLAFRETADPLQTETELKHVRENPIQAPPRSGPSAPPSPSPESAAPAPGFAPLTRRVIQNNFGELEIAVSPDGQNIVIGNQSLWAASNDGGQTFPLSGGIAFGGGDPSLGWGQSGSFYYAGIRGGCQAADVTGPFGYTCTGVARSNNNGQTFPIVGNASLCPNNDPNSPPNPPLANRCFPDQEHIAVDRVNAGGGGDQVYNTWRNFDATDQDPALTCSQDSGVTWTLGSVLTPGAGAFPRIGAGQDGFVYVVWLDGGNYMLRKYSSCASGLVPQGAAVAVTVRTPIICPFVGHDRCDQNPSSQTIAVDDTNPNHVYFAYAEDGGGGTDNIFVQDSVNGGAAWPGARTVQVNSAAAGKRIMPWVCTTGGEAFVTWYDRRAATPCPVPPCAAPNDVTDYYGGRAGLDFGGNLVAGGEFQITEVPDNWCDSGWPCRTREVASSDQCSSQPQLAGRCCDAATAGCPGSQQACDFSDTIANPALCPAGETCNTGGGCPKYGDYNGNACAAGRLFAAWASRVAPPSIPVDANNAIDIFFAGQIVGDVPQIQIPGDVQLPDACVGTTNTATLNVCNTGTANLAVTSISSSNPQFAVTTPSSGYPVIVSPDFCFPFQVRFTPTSSGSKSATLTVNSNDPSNPQVTVQATGKGGEPNIDTVIANSGSFGNVCIGSFKDLDLTVHNSGACSLTLSDILSSGAEFHTASVMAFPVTIEAGNSLVVPIRYEPTNLGADVATITIASDDPDTPNKVVNVSGNAPPGDIVVTGSTDFGDVCGGVQAEKVVSVCNTGLCTLAVVSAFLSAPGPPNAPDCADFTIINNPFPNDVSPDFCVPLTIRFTPTSGGPKACDLVIVSDDPDENPVILVVTGNTPAPSIDVPPDQGFPPTVIQSVGPCRSEAPFPVSNTGQCNLTITDLAITSNQDEYSLSGLPSFPIILEPGHIAGEGDLNNVFEPDILGRPRTGVVKVTYVSDAVTGATTDVTRALCGEGVRTGARVLVTAGGVPLASVEQIKLQRINANRNRSLLDTVDNARNLALQAEIPGAPCAPFQFHREYGTVLNPIQLLPGSYQVTATAIVNGKRTHKTVGFDVNTCGFNPTIMINF